MKICVYYSVQIAYTYIKFCSFQIEAQKANLKISDLKRGIIAGLTKAG